MLRQLKLDGQARLGKGVVDYAETLGLVPAATLEHVGTHLASVASQAPLLAATHYIRYLWQVCSLSISFHGDALHLADYFRDAWLGASHLDCKPTGGAHFCLSSIACLPACLVSVLHDVQPASGHMSYLQSAHLSSWIRV